MNQSLSDFAQYALEIALEKKKGLVPIFSNQSNSQNQALSFVIDYLKENFSGFLVYKNNKFPEDDLKELDLFLKPNTVIVINHISNSFQYNDLLELSKNNLIIAGFESFCSFHNPLHDFIYRFQRISHVDYDVIKQHIPLALFCYLLENKHTLEYRLFNLCETNNH